MNGEPTDEQLAEIAEQSREIDEAEAAYERERTRQERAEEQGTDGGEGW